jgi:hypothetical protein
MKEGALTNNANALANVEKCKTLSQLNNVIKNAKADLAAGKDVATAQKVYDAAVGRYWEMSAAKHEAGAAVDRALWTALHAYEYLKGQEKGKTSRATYLRRKISQTDIVTAVSGSVLKGGKTSGLQALRDMGRLDASFEAVVVKYADSFAPEVVAAAKRTLADLRD